MGVKAAELEVEISADASRATSAINNLTSHLGQIASHAGKAGVAAGSAFLTPFRGAMSTAIGSVGKLTDGLGKLGLAGQGVQQITGLVTGLGKSLVSGNADFEDYNVRFATLIENSEDFKRKYAGLTSETERYAKAQELAKDQMKDLAAFGAATPFDLPGVVKAQTVLMGFGLTADNAKERFGQSGKDILRIAGDVASGSGASFEEISGYIGKFANGATGEAISRFQELGITTRSELEKMGLKFSGTGELIANSQADLDKATSVLLSTMNNKYQGLMDKQSGTLKGMLSNLGDWKDGMIRTLTQPFFEPLKAALSGFLDFVDPNKNPKFKQATDALVSGIKTAITDTAIVVNTLGDILSPFWTKMAWGFGVVRDSVLTFKSAMKGEWVDSNKIMPIHRAVGNFANILRTTVIPAIQYFIDGFKGLSGGDTKLDVIANQFGQIASKVFEALQALSPLKTIFDVIVGFFNGGLNGALEALTQHIYDFFDAFGMGEQAMDVLQNISETVRGVIAQVMPTLVSFGQTIAASVGPIFTSLGNVLQTNIIPGIQKLASSFMEFLPNIIAFGQGLITTLLPVFQGLAAFIADPLLPIIGNLFSLFVDVGVPIFMQLFNIIKTIAMPIIAGFADIFTTMVIPAITQAGQWINTNLIPALRIIGTFISTNVMPILQQLANFVAQNIPTAFQIVKGVISTVWGAISGIISTGWNIVSGIFNAIKSALGTLGDVYNTFKGVVDTVWKAVSDFIKTSWDIIKGIWDGITGALKTLGDKFNELKTLVGQVWDNITGAIKKAWDDITKSVGEAIGGILAEVGTWPGKMLDAAAKVGQALIDGFINAVKNGAKAVADAVTGVFSGPVDMVKGIFGIHSPSRVFYDMADYVIQGFVNGLTDNKDAPKDAMGNVMGGVKEEAVKRLSDLADMVSKVAGAGSQMQDLLDKIRGFKPIEEATMTSFVGAIKDLSEKLVATYQMVNGKALEAAAKLSDDLGKIAQTATAFMQPLESLVKYSEVAADRFIAFGTNINQLVDNMVWLAQHMNLEYVQSAAIFSNSFKTIGEAIQPMVQAMSSLKDYSDISLEIMNTFGDNIRYMIIVAHDLAIKFTDEYLGSLKKFTDVLGPTMSALGTAVQTLTGLSQFSEISLKTYLNFSDNLQFMINLAQELGSRITEEVAPVFKRFGDAITSAFGGLKSAVDFFAALKDWTDIPVQTILQLQFLVDLTIASVSGLAEKFTKEVLDSVAKFAESSGKMFTAFKGSIDFFKALAELPDIGDDALEQFILKIDQLITKAQGAVWRAISRIDLTLTDVNSLKDKTVLFKEGMIAIAKTLGEIAPGALGELRLGDSNINTNITPSQASGSSSGTLGSTYTEKGGSATINMNISVEPGADAGKAGGAIAEEVINQLQRLGLDIRANRAFTGSGSTF